MKTILLTSKELALRLLGEASNYELNYLAGALDVLTRRYLADGVRPGIDNQAVAKEVGEMNISKTIQHALIEKLRRNHFKLEWITDTYDDVAGFRLHEQRAGMQQLNERPSIDSAFGGQEVPQTFSICQLTENTLERDYNVK